MILDLKVRPNHEVYIISAGRADCVKTRKVFPHAAIVILDEQGDEYAKYNDPPIYRTAPGKNGNPSKARNWILNAFPNERKIILDDDYLYFGYHEGGRTNVKATLERTIRFCNMMFDMAEDCGTVLWGVNQQSDPKFYREYSPFALKSIVLGPFMGILKTDLRFDEDIWLKEDYDFSLQVLAQHRCILRANKWHYMVDHIRGVGGVVTKRTSELEAQHMARLKEKWGTKIVGGRKGRHSINPIIRWPVKGI